MMKKIIFLIFLFLGLLSNAQDMAHMKVVYGLEDNLLQGLLNFENISVNQVLLSGSEIADKDYQLVLKEYVKGTLKKRTVLFDSSEGDFFRIKHDPFRFVVFSQITERNQFKIELQFDGFTSKKYYFELKNTDYPYALKDFLGSRQEIEVPISGFHILALITPTVHYDGSASYCEVAQSDVAAEDLGKYYDMSQNFLLEMKIK